MHKCSNRNRAVFFLKLGLYFFSHSFSGIKIYNLRGSLLGLRLKGKAAIINPSKNLLPLYKILLFLRDITKINGSLLLISDFLDTSNALLKYLELLPNVYCLDTGSIIPGFIGNLKWVS